MQDLKRKKLKFTEHGKLVVEGKERREERKNEYVHRGITIQRSFKREWQLTDDIEIKDVIFEDGLLSVNVGKGSSRASCS